MNKIIRTIAYFTDNPSEETVRRLETLRALFAQNDFLVQTIRLTTNLDSIEEVRAIIPEISIRVGLGSKPLKWFKTNLESFNNSTNVNVNIDLSKGDINLEHVDLLFKVIKGNSSNTFNFNYLFNSVPTPYYPSSYYKENGFAVGLQPTNLAENKISLAEWFEAMSETWDLILDLMEYEHDFLGIDSSIAPLYEGTSSFINLLKKFGYDYATSFTTDVYTQITNFIKQNNPKPYGLNGLMMPCLEDFELTKEYEKGGFSIERNIFVSLHSGLGIDTYPIGINESPMRVLEILKLMQALSNKYKKPLAVRFVSDGKSEVGDMSDFQNEYLKDVVIRSL